MSGFESMYYLDEKEGTVHNSAFDEGHGGGAVPNGQRVPVGNFIAIIQAVSVAKSKGFSNSAPCGYCENREGEENREAIREIAENL